MIDRAMQWLPAGGGAWLTLNELRVALRARSGKSVTQLIGVLLVLAWCAFGIFAAEQLIHTPLAPDPVTNVAVLVVAVLMFSFMTTQAILASQQALYGAGDLDLLFSAPVSPRTVLTAKLVGITALVALTYAMLVLPIAVPIAVLGHPGLFGIPALMLALAMTAACLGLAITLVLARIAGPRAARTVGQIVAALSGGAVFIASQIWSHGERANRQAGAEILFRALRRSQFAEHGVGALPGAAAFGDPAAVFGLLGGAGLIFAATVWAMHTLFLSGYRAGGMKLGGRRRAATSRVGRHFSDGLFGAVFRKEWLLLARDPALAFQLVLRLIYLFPLFFVVFKPRDGISFGPGLAFASVLITGQLVSSFAWLTISAEDAPDLIAVAPVDPKRIKRTKLAAALAMAAPVGVLLPLGVAVESPLGAVAALGFTALAGWLTGLLEVTLGKPAPRSGFQRRRQGSVVRGIAELAITMALGGMAALAVYFLS